MPLFIGPTGYSSTGQVLYNLNGVITGNANFAWDTVNNDRLNINGSLYGAGFALVGNPAGVGIGINYTQTGLQLAATSVVSFGSSGINSPDLGLYRNAAGVLEVNNNTPGTFADFKMRHHIVSGLRATNAAAPTIASTGTIAPTTSIVFISGTAAIATITAPSPISAGGGQITLIPTGIFTTTTAGNIALASTAVVNKALTMTYDVTTTKWYPSY